MFQISAENKKYEIKVAPINPKAPQLLIDIYLKNPTIQEQKAKKVQLLVDTGCTTSILINQSIIDLLKLHRQPIAYTEIKTPLGTFKQEVSEEIQLIWYDLDNNKYSIKLPYALGINSAQNLLCLKALELMDISVDIQNKKVYGYVFPEAQTGYYPSPNLDEIQDQ